jgi:hypothetical protein
MSEFGDRVNAQRAVLRAVNSAAWPEELFGLSNQAIDRWIDKSSMSPNSEIVRLVRLTSERLSFLANRSQMQITEDYRRVSHDIKQLTAQILEAVGRPQS